MAKGLKDAKTNESDAGVEVAARISEIDEGLYQVSIAAQAKLEDEKALARVIQRALKPLLAKARR